MAARIGLAMGRSRLLRRSTAVSCALGAALVVAAGMIERSVASAGAVDRALAATFNLVVPLVSFGLAIEASGRGNLREGVWPAARYGVARREVGLGLVAATAVAAAAAGAALSALAVLAAHGQGNPGVAVDTVMSGWIGALTAAAYAAWFMLGATFGRRGGGRWAPLIVDFAVGGSSGVAGAVLPRGNALSLLGEAAPLGMSQAASSAVLAVSVVVLGGAAAFACRD